MNGTGRVVLAAGLVLAAAGCGGGDGGSRTAASPGANGARPTVRTWAPAPPAVPPPGVPVPPTGPPSPWPVPPPGRPSPPWPMPPTGSPWPVPTPATPGAPLPRASNGTDLGACRKGRCEVQVSPHDRIPVPSRLGVNELRVTAITGDTITLRGTAPGTSLNVTLSGNAGATSVMNDLAISLVAIADGKAVLRIAAVRGW